jgi:transcriptional regulator with XRE-family HTH domain
VKISPQRITEPRIAIVLDYVGANVRRLRIARGLTQDQLAEVVGLHITYVRRIERGGVNISLGVLLMLAHALAVKPEELLEPAKLPPLKRGRPLKKPPAKK